MPAAHAAFLVMVGSVCFVGALIYFHLEDKMFDGIGMIFGGMPARNFDLQLRAYSAPFAESADTEKINEINHGGKVSFVSISRRMFRSRFAMN